MAPTLPAPSMSPLQQLATKERLHGMPGHLSPEQAHALVSFKAELSAHGYYVEEKGDAEASVDDATLLRFLRARKFDVAGAYGQFTATEDWRVRENVAALYDEMDVEEFMEAQRVYPQWTGRRDKNGLPLYVFKISELTKEKINAYSKDPEKLVPRMIGLYEHMVQFILPFASSVPHTPDIPISATTTIVDISGVSLARFWALRSHMQRASTLATANYAETLGTIMIVGAPNFFSIVWGWIGKWFDPGTVEKIHILSDSQALPVLSRFVALEDLPVQFGGKLPWAYGDNSPILDEATKETIGLEELPRGSLRWVRGELYLKGTGRSVEEVIKCTPSRVSVDKVLEGEIEATTVDAVVLAEDTDEGVRDVWTTAREEPAAPVKELAAAMEGTTL